MRGIAQQWIQGEVRGVRTVVGVVDGVVLRVLRGRPLERDRARRDRRRLDVGWSARSPCKTVEYR